MIYGQGGPIAKLMDAVTGRVQTITLPTPIRRELNPYEDVYLDLGQDANGERMLIFQGVRFQTRLIFSSRADNQSDVVNVVRVRRWRGPSRTVALQPHSDITGIRHTCEVVATDLRRHDGKVTAEEISLELRGVDILAQEPNLQLDRISGKRGQRNLRVAAWGEDES